MALIDQARNYIKQFWDIEPNDDPMWDLIVKHRTIQSVDTFFYAPRGMFELQGEAATPYLVAGNAPLLYDHASQSFIITGTAEPIEAYIEAYLRFGDPHQVPGPIVQLTSWENGAQKINATKAVRRHTGYGLAEAKACIDRVLEGKEVKITTADAEAAAELARALIQLGFVAKQNSIPRYS